MEYSALNQKNETIHIEIQNLLQEFKEKESGIQGQMVLSFPAGVPIASTWKGQMDPVLVGAVSAAVKLTFQHLSEGLKKGNLKRLYVNSENGKTIIQNAGDKAILTTMIDFDADLYRLSFMVGDMTKKIDRALTNY